MKSGSAKDLLVIYHQECIDGLASAWSVDKKHGQDLKTNSTFIPYGHHAGATAEKNILAATTSNSDILFVDMAPTREFLKKILAVKPRSVRIFDHP